MMAFHHDKKHKRIWGNKYLFSQYTTILTYVALCLLWQTDKNES